MLLQVRKQIDILGNTMHSTGEAVLYYQKKTKMEKTTMVLIDRSPLSIQRAVRILPLIHNRVGQVVKKMRADVSSWGMKQKVAFYIIFKDKFLNYLFPRFVKGI